LGTFILNQEIYQNTLVLGVTKYSDRRVAAIARINVNFYLVSALTDGLNRLSVPTHQQNVDRFGVCRSHQGSSVLLPH
jgi:hypothetical protein